MKIARLQIFAALLMVVMAACTANKSVPAKAEKAPPSCWWKQFVHMALEHTHRAYVLAKGELVLQGESKQMATDPELIVSYLGEGELVHEEQEQKSTSRRRKNVATT